MPPETTVKGRLPMMRFNPVTKSPPVPRSTPSASQTTSTFGVAAKNRSSAGNASVRSTLCGFGLSCLTCTRAALAVIIEMSRPPSDNGIRATPRLSASARAIISSAVRRRSSHAAAAGQPSSSITRSGTLRLELASGGFHKGPAAAMTTSAASARRSSTSHHGVRDGVSSFGAISNSSRVGGNSIVRGRGGTSRSSHHKMGRPKSPSRTRGCAKARGKPEIMRSRPRRCAPSGGFG